MINRNIVLTSARLRLEPLNPAHLPALRECCQDEMLWEYTFQPSPFGTESSARAWLDEALNTRAHMPFAIIDLPTERVIGSTRFADITPEHRKLEIGWTFIAREFWRTHVNRECKLLMLRYAFEEWNALRVALKAEAVNQRSRNAMLAWGATYEGTLRNFRIRPSDGSVRAVSFYSVIKEEWPNVRERLEQLLSARSESPVST